MTKYLTALLALLFVYFVAEPKCEASPSQDYAAQLHIIQHMSARFEVDVDVVFEPCGELNGSYYPSTNTIHLCTESSESPAAGRFIAAHEMAHAILWNLNGDLSEYHADELAALVLLANEDDVDALQGAAVWFVTMDNVKHPGQSHPSDQYRAIWLLKMVDGYLARDYPSKVLYQGTLVRYVLMLEHDTASDSED